MKGDRERCLEAGMDGYLAKPIRAQELYDMVENSTGPRDVLPAAPSQSTEPSQLCDWAAGLERVGGDEGLLREIAGLMSSECPKLLADIQRAIAARDAAKLKLAAHTLKGSLDNIGALAARVHAQELETQGRDNQLADASAACRRLELELDRLQPELAAFAAGRLPLPKR
jgi:HPt (histidine-containing phosphotransfer) domain-containing protein